ncbi:putative serine/threonine-protein kinase F31E3.2 [Hypsibius exemplaris]|uniref:Serine/threonine-protein kinase F31E3.2 n=1 Tax=Hypsibius exemplaris TaxID=2072580 RepID=A0A9X6RKZ9_HYPEX|nr:putative serine/threonine-protein kinase F31E3.2 [Hypsibius exemplaris]
MPRLHSRLSGFRSFFSYPTSIPAFPATAPCKSVKLLAFRPTSGSFSLPTPPPSSHGSVKSNLSAVTSSASSSGSSGGSAYKRSARGRSLHRCSGSGLASSHRRIPHASRLEEMKTPYPVTNKEAIFLPQFPIRSATSRNRVVLEETPLSSGQFGDVTRVIVNGRVCALKKVRKNFVVRFHTVQQVKDEATIQKEFCVHPFLVQAFDSWQDRINLCILSEFVPGGNLSSYWRKYGPFPEEVVRIWGLEIGLALDHLHSRNILYRDLKLANTLLDEHGHLKLADFGLAKILVNGKTRAKTICGTLNYMAPEVLREQEYDAAADWWSFGIALYALLVGTYPIEPDGDHVQMCEAVMGHSYLDPDVVKRGLLSPAAVHLFDRILRKNPATRLNRLQDLKDERFFGGVTLVNVYRKMVSPLVLLRQYKPHKTAYHLKSPKTLSNHLSPVFESDLDMGSGSII